MNALNLGNNILKLRKKEIIYQESVISELKSLIFQILNDKSV